MCNGDTVEARCSGASSFFVVVVAVDAVDYYTQVGIVVLTIDEYLPTDPPSVPDGPPNGPVRRSSQSIAPQVGWTPDAHPTQSHATMDWRGQG